MKLQFITFAVLVQEATILSKSKPKPKPKNKPLL